MSQIARIKAALLDGESLTPIDALARFGCFRLGARIYDLRQAGLPIESERHQVDAETTVARYSMTPEARKAARGAV